MIGYVYLMINPAFPNLVKIGRTAKSSEARAAELSTTGTPDKFIVVFDVLVDDCIELESEMHAIFTSSRYANNREFFEIPLKTAIETLQSVSKDRVIDETGLAQVGANSVADWQVDKVGYYIYLAFLGDENSAKYKESLPNGGLFRIGLVELDIDENEIDEVAVKNSLCKDLVQYYSNFGWVEMGDVRMRISEEIPARILWFLHMFDVGRSQRGRLENIIKGIISTNIESYDVKEWLQVFDAQTVVRLPAAYNTSCGDALCGAALTALENYYAELKAIEADASRKKSLSAAQSKKGKF